MGAEPDAAAARGDGFGEFSDVRVALAGSQIFASTTAPLQPRSDLALWGVQSGICFFVARLTPSMRLLGFVIALGKLIF